jgi:DNA-directed RNA polymerase specialized sigma24 family protein
LRFTGFFHDGVCFSGRPDMDFEPSPTQQLMGRLFAQNYDWLCGRLRSRLDCRHSAEDLASETFVRLLGLPDPHVCLPRACRFSLASCTLNACDDRTKNH